MKYEDLDDSQKEKARDWLREHTFTDNTDWSCTYADVDSMAALLGIEIDRRRYETMGGGIGSEPTIYFSGFSSQGDGACFEGGYEYKKGAVKAIIAATNDAELLRIAKGLQDVQRRHFYKLRARCTHRGHYYHSGCMDVEVSHGDDSYRDIGDAEQDVRDLLRSFADWIYDQLEEEHDYQTSDEVLEETILANEYDFDVGDGGIRI